MTSLLSVCTATSSRRGFRVYSRFRNSSHQHSATKPSLRMSFQIQRQLQHSLSRATQHLSVSTSRSITTTTVRQKNPHQKQEALYPNSSSLQQLMFLALTTLVITTSSWESRKRATTEGLYRAATTTVHSNKVSSQHRSQQQLALPSESSSRRIYDISVRAIKGGRVTMEDEYVVADGGRFAAVFDGHGGGGVSTFLKHHLYDTIHSYLGTVLQQQSGDMSQPTVASQVQALRMAFTHVDERILQDDSLQYQGSTAVAVVLHETEDGHRTLLSANVGDSRAILSRRGRAVDLTRDHKPNEEKEKARILAMGETIEWDRFAKVHRVRNLSLSRAIGDRYAKPVVSGEVEIKHFPVLDDGDEFVLLASDGLWDVMTSQDAVNYVHQRMEKELARGSLDKHDDLESYKLVLRRNMAKFVAREALKRGSGDNICVLMVWLKDVDKRV